MNRTPGSPGQQGSLTLAAAVEYAGLGWRVFPVWQVRAGVCCCPKAERCKHPGKHPRTRHGHAGATTDVSVIRTWKWATANIGIATGHDSGVLVIDVDPRNGGEQSLKELKQRLGPLPPCPWVKTGGGGSHGYFRDPGVPVRTSLDVPGVDIKADGGFVVAPPSVHMDGGIYRWEVAPQAVPPPDLPPAWLEALKRERERGLPITPSQKENSPCYRDDGGRQKTTEDVQGRKRDILCLSPAGDSIERFVETCIQKTLPQSAGQRHKAVFRLVRYLQGHPEVADWPLKRLRPIADRWYDLAVERLGPDQIQANKDDNWFDFAEGWDKVNYPGEGGLMMMMLERAQRADVSEVAKQYASPELRLLIGLCRELQREAGAEPFYLATTTLERLLGLNRMRAWRWLDGLVRDGVLDPIERGDPRTRKATRYRYLGD